jgi:hypothetical protein
MMRVGTRLALEMALKSIAGKLWYRYYDHTCTGPCGDMFITIDNPTGYTGLSLEITEGGIKYTLMPDSGPTPNKLTELTAGRQRSK